MYPPIVVVYVFPCWVFCLTAIKAALYLRNICLGIIGLCLMQAWIYSRHSCMRMPVYLLVQLLPNRLFVYRKANKPSVRVQ